MRCWESLVCSELKPASQLERRALIPKLACLIKIWDELDPEDLNGNRLLTIAT